MDNGDADNDDDDDDDDDDEDDDPELIAADVIAAEVWHFFDGNGQQGPVSAADLATRRAQGLLTAGAAPLFWREGLEQWASLEELPELLELMNAADQV
jgi:hypothetical protein